MITITKVEVQDKNKSRVNIYVDNEFYSGLNLDVCVKYALKQGLSIEQSKLDEIMLESEKGVALNKAIKYMSSAIKTTKQIRDYLNKKEYDKQVVDYCIIKLKEYNYLDDMAFAKAYVNSNGSKCGKLKLTAQLKSKGISKDIIEEVLNDWQPQDDDIMRVALKKLGNKQPTYENLTKVMVFLNSRGYEYDQIKSVINKLKEDDYEDRY